MVKKIRLILSFLSALLVTSMAEAVICRIDVLKRVVNGQNYFLHCLAVMPCECLSLDLDKQREALGRTRFNEIQAAFKNKLDQMTFEQGEELVTYAERLGVGQFVLINEDLFEYEGNDEVLKARLQKLKSHMRQQMTAGEIGVLQHSTGLFKSRNWPVINADCRQIALNVQKEKGVDRRFPDLLNQLMREVDKSPASEEIKDFSKMRLGVARLEFTSLRRGNLFDHLQMMGEQLVDARIPHLVAQQSHVKHILLLIEGQQIDTLMEPFSLMGYRSVATAGKFAAKNFAKFHDDVTARFVHGIQDGDMSALDVALNLKKVFGTIGNELGLPAPTATTDDDEEKKTIPVLSSSNSSGLSDEVPIICTVCSQIKEVIAPCPRCKTVWYCGAECRAKHIEVCEEKE